MMYEIYLLIIALAMMAKHGRPRKGRSMSNYLRGNVDEQLDLGTLAARTAIQIAFDETVDERTRITSLVATWAMDQFTVAAGDGPIMVGVNHSDYTLAEVQEWIDNTGSWSSGDLVSQEVGRRKIRMAGVFEASAQAGGAYALNDGKPIKMKLNWDLNSGQGLELWAMNLGDSALATTIPSVFVQGHANLFVK